MLAGAATLGVLIVGLAWIVVTGLLARSQLTQVKRELPQLRQAVLANHVDEARRLANRIAEQTDRAHALTTGPAWWVTANLPVIGTPLQTVRVMSASADDVGAHVVPSVVELADRVRGMRPHDGSVDLSQIQGLGAQLHAAARAAHRAADRVAATDSSWLNQVASARSSLVDQLSQVDGELAGADRAVRITVPMLGSSRPQRYFVGFLNEAEARGIGGIPGAYAIVRADKGHITFEHFGSDTDLRHVRADVQMDAQYRRLYGQDDPTGTFPNSDISPDFRDAGRIWAGMWEAKTGQHVDGAVAIDPTALSYVLAVTGPAAIANGEQVSAGNVVALTQQTQYAKFDSVSKRKDYVVSVARAVSDRLTRSADPRRLLTAISRAAKERRFLVWTADAGLERDIGAAHWGGVVGAPVGTPHTGFVVTNAAGSKLDYYLDRSMTYERTLCTVNSPAVARFTLTNRAPANLPAYVTIRADKPAAYRPGDNHVLVTYYASAGARIGAVTVDGRPARVATAVEDGLTTMTVSLELPAGRARTVEIRLTEPGALEPMKVLRQPLVRPMTVDIRSRCGN